MENLVLVFLKLPRPGRVKTRLAASVGEEEAARIYRRMVEAVVCGLPGRDSVRFVFSPREGEGELREWIGGLPGWETREVDCRPQVEGDLGVRLEAAFAEAFSEGRRRVAAIGTDCVDVTERHFVETWAALDSGADVVFGPATDGGYYLVATRGPVRALFSDMIWSDPRTLELSVERVRRAGLVPHLLEPLTDIDTLADLQAVRADWS